MHPEDDDRIEAPPPSPELGAALAELLAPPDQLGARVERGVGATLSARSAAGTVGDLLGVGWRTLGLLLGDGEDAVDGSETP